MIAIILITLVLLFLLNVTSPLLATLIFLGLCYGYWRVFVYRRRDDDDDEPDNKWDY